MKESTPSSLESFKPVDYKTFRIYREIISALDTRHLDDANNLLALFITDPGMMGAREVETLGALIFEYKGNKNSPMFIDVFKQAVDNFFLEAAKRDLLHKEGDAEDFGLIDGN